MINCFYVYIYLDPRKPGKYCYKDISFLYEPIYVGKGRNRRYLDHLKKSKYFNPYFKNKLIKISKVVGLNNLKKCILIFKSNLLQKEALNIERYLIKEIGRLDLKTGTLTNLTDGGDGCVNVSKETREKISISLVGRFVGNKHPLFGKSPSKETREKMSKAAIGKHCGEKNPSFGKVTSKETREKQSRVKIGKYCGDKNPFFGKYHSKESREKMSKNLSGEKHHLFGKKHSEETKRKMSDVKKGSKNPMFGKHLSESCKLKLSNALSGEKSSSAKLKEKEVIKIKELLMQNIFSKEDIVKRFKTTRQNIRRIEIGKTWKNVK